MPDIVNLRLARKRRRRAEKEHAAAENRAVYGRSADAVRHQEQVRALDRKRLEGHRRDPSGADDPEG